MLIVRRRVGEAIVIADAIEVEITEISTNRVRLGIRAPREVSVVRKETLSVADENRRAAALAASADRVARMLGGG